MIFSIFVFVVIFLIYHYGTLSGIDAWAKDEGILIENKQVCFWPYKYTGLNLNPSFYGLVTIQKDGKSCAGLIRISKNLMGKRVYVFYRQG